MSAAVRHRYGFDDLRRFAAGLGAAAGLPPARALALASHLLWFDAAGAAVLGIATLPTWLEAIEDRRIDPTAAGRVTSEQTSVACLDGENGPAPLVLERAAGLAVEKARESGVGLVRVIGAGPLRSSAPAAAGIALGPMAGWVIGPGRCWSLALPTQGGLPLVVDSGLADAEGGDGSGSASTLLEGFWSGTEVLRPEGGWLLAAAAIPALEAFATFDERLAAVLAGMTAAPGRLTPETWEDRRRRVRHEGLRVEASAWKSLIARARRHAIAAPEPLAD